MMRSVAGIALVVVCVSCSSKSTTPETVPVADAAPPPIPVGKSPRRGKPSNVVGGFKIVLPTITLQPGEERTPCYVAPMQITGSSKMVGGGLLTVGKGMHHGNVTTRPRRPDSTDTLRPCPKESTGALGGEGQDVVDGGSVLFGSTTQIMGEEWQSFPDGMAFKVRDNFEIAARMHYINTTKEPLTLSPTYEWFTVDESKVTTELGPFFWVYKGFEIPPHQQLTVKADCPIPGDMHVVTLMPHMHKLGTAFRAGWVGGALDGQLFMDSKGYDPEESMIQQYEPAVDLSLGDGVSFSCSWDNTFDKTIVEGIGDNEMCMAFGYGYPPSAMYTLMGNSGGLCPAITPNQ